MIYPVNKKYYYDIRPISHTYSTKILLEKCNFDIYLIFLSGARCGGYVNADFFHLITVTVRTLTFSKKVDTITQGVPKVKCLVLVILKCNSSSSWSRMVIQTSKPLEFC